MLPIAALDSILLAACAVLAFAAVVVIPVALPLTSLPSDEGTPLAGPRPLVAAAAGVPLAVSMILPAGPLAGLLALPWVLVTLRLALFGVRRFLVTPRRRLEEIAIDVACFELVVGAVWAFVYRSGGVMFGFTGTQTLLTALHFHYAGFGAALACGLTGRLVATGLRRSVYRIAATGITGGTIALAIGISTTHIVEFSTACALAGCVALFGLLTLSLALAPPVEARPLSVAVRIGLAFSGLSAMSAMVPAVRFAGIGFAGLDGASFRRMLFEHGLVNALGFVGVGLLALRARRPESRWRAGIPFSRLGARGRVGRRFFDDAGLVDAARDPHGLTENFADYDRSCHPDVRAFYEDTRDHILVVRPQWQPGFRLAGRMWHALARRFGQLALPIDERSDGPTVTSRVLALRDDLDGRTSVRAWVRTYAEADGSEGRPVYVAAYSSHVRAGRRTMNIAFPLPGGNMTSILRVDPLGRAGGVRLTTRQRDNGDDDGDEGVWAVVAGHGSRLPLDETIDVWSANADPGWVARLAPPTSVDPGACTVLATHDMWMFGLRYVRLTYFIARRTGVTRP